MPYLDAAAIEAQIATLGSAAPCSRIAMNAPTVIDGGGSTTYSYLKVGNGSGAGRPTVLIVAGMHARELAQPDAVLSFVDKLATAYRTSAAFSIPAYTNPAGATFGPVSMPAPTVKRLVDSVDLILVPLANPDGRAFALSNPANLQWRKNRAPRVTAANPATVGVDLNRNFAIAWDFEVYLDTAAAAAIEIATTSKNAAKETFIGPQAAGPASQPETQNLVWILDHNPVTYVIDLHSKIGKVMYPWGIEENGTNPAQNVRDHGFDRGGANPLKRDGVLGSAYKEYFPDTTPVRLLAAHDRIAKSMSAGILAATGRSYGTGPIATTLYPATGNLTDYAFSRQFAAGSPAIYSFAIEFGFDSDGFQPLYADPEGYPKIEREIHAALLRFVEAAIPPVASPTGGAGGGGGPCPFTIAIRDSTAGGSWLTTLRAGRAALIGRRGTRGLMMATDRAYRTVGARLEPTLQRSRLARRLVAQGVVRPLASLTAHFVGTTHE